MSMAFNPTYYQNERTDVFQAFLSAPPPKDWATFAEEHYNTFGWLEGSNPNAFFNTTYYLQSNLDVANAGVNPLQHFLTFGASEGRKPNADFVSFDDFNTDTYAAANEDLAGAGITTPEALYAHFATFGFAEDRPGVQTNDGEEIGAGGVPGAPAEDAPVIGDTLTLTVGVDELPGTPNNDTFRAVIANSLESFDILDGGAGDDVLNISAGAMAAGTNAAPLAPVIRNIERINNSDIDTVLSLTDVTDVGQIWTTGTQVAGTGGYNNANLATTFGIQGAASGTAIINYAGSLAGTTAINLAVGMTAAGQTATFNFNNTAVNQNGQLEVVNLTAGGVASTVDITALTAVDTINVGGEGRVTVENTNATLRTFDAGENTGGVTYVSGDLTGAATVTGSSGNDILDFSNVTGNFAMTINAGAGNNQITGGAGRDEINAGAGNDIVNGSAAGDTITLGAGNDVMVYSALNQSLIGNADRDVITDFNQSGNDTIDLSGVAATGLTSAANLLNIQNAVDALAGTATLADAVAAMDGAITFAANTVAHFQFQGNTYVVVNDGTAGFDADDDMVIELTGTVALSASDFEFA